MRTISIYNNNLPHNKEMREVLAKKIKEYGFNTGRDGELMFCLGGDGTFLKAMRRNLREDPIFIGINTGNLGFLSEFRFDDVERVLGLIKNGNYNIQTLPIYEANVYSPTKGKRKFFFLNDAVIEKKSELSIFSSIHLNDQRFCEVAGDGIIVSSSIGSTGYAVSAGGAISIDCDEVLQITPNNPIYSRKYQSLTKPVILNGTNEITIYPSVKKKRRFRIVLDGKGVKIPDVKYIEIKQSPYQARLLRSKGFNSAQNLLEKMMMQQDDFLDDDRLY